MQIKLKRHNEDEFGTHGQFTTDFGEILCQTVEQPWRDNHPYIEGEIDQVSCIPPGNYKCTPYNSPHHPDCWKINDVPGRTDVLIHTGNTEADTKGCVIVGMAWNKEGVLRSKEAIAYLHKRGLTEFDLEVIAVS